MELSNESNALDVYMYQVNQSSKLLTKEEEYETALASHEGDVKARQRMIQSNLRLVINIAKRYQHTSLPLVDIIQEGNTGLIHAVEKFDATKGFRFSTYAVWWIKNNIERFIMNQSRTIRVPIHIGKVYKRILKTAREQELDLQCNQDVMTLAELLEMQHGQVTEVLSYYFNEASLDKTIVTDRDSSTALVDMLEDHSICKPNEELEDADTLCYLDEVLGHLSDRDRKIIELRFGLGEEDPLTLHVIGERLSMSRERIRQIINLSLQKIQPELLQNTVQKQDYLN
ncbi:MAG: sigma-70 family RNA polymerase sigma factor [Moritella sp.]|uniref:sigma-70 family RNA polymerase sigma factor n=1 Tax=Moritella sp. TaxID=78556 RepID=UPI0029A6E4AF|nr:sigma-70 family RNA polymerase sigma factor [Moritella sp.]MDX2321339.1 sigma-70 family RNA polymerase sigma factor [Moritella sp.]